MQMRLPRTLRIPNPLLHNPFRLLHKQPVQINRIAIHPAHRIILPEDIIARLLVILVHHGAMAFPFLGELVRGAAVAALVGLLRFGHAGGAFGGFLAGEGAEMVVFGFGGVGGGVVEGWGVLGIGGDGERGRAYRRRLVGLLDRTYLCK